MLTCAHSGDVITFQRLPEDEKSKWMEQWMALVAENDALLRPVGAPRGLLHTGGRSTRAAPQGGVADLLLY